MIGGILVGAFVLYEIFKPGSGAFRPSTAPRQTTDGTIISGLVSVIPGIITSLTAPTGPLATGQSAWGQSDVTKATYDANGGNLYYTNVGGEGLSSGALPNYGYADTHPGAALPEGVYGPPVPVDSSAVTGGDDGLVSV